MERVLRGKEIFEIIPFDYNSNVLCYPIRHHSPACSFHLHSVIEKYQPDCILVEGPETANNLISLLVSEDTELPVAFYYYYKDKEGLISEEKGDYKCYYPFLECSPEYQAMKKAEQLGIEHRFIDLPYGEILIHTASESGLRTKKRQDNYNDDSYLVQSHYYKKLCEEAQVRNFEEFWEKYFEIDGIRLPEEEFVANLLTYCYYTRKDSKQEELMQDGCLIREQYMLQQIQQAKQRFQKVLVVTGGFHTVSLAKNCAMDQEQSQVTNVQKATEKPEYTEQKIKLHDLTKEEQNAYPMAYSYEAADALNGYASGMQNPGFYDHIFAGLMQERSQEQQYEHVYQEAVLDLLLKTAKDAKKQNLLITMSDISGAMNLSLGLAQLRNKQVPGLYELYDGVMSAFIKGELTASSGLPLDLLRKNAMGSKIGKVSCLSKLIPILADFERQCKIYGIAEKSILEKEIELSIYTKKKHRDISYFFHQMDFLQTQFVKLKKGPNHLQNQDKNRVKETWTYHWSSNMVATLIDHSVEGGMIREVCIRVASKRISKERTVKEAARIYVECFLMGIGITELTTTGMEEILKLDSDFFSLGQGLYYMQMLSRLQLLFDHQTDETLQWKKTMFYKALALLPQMVNVESEQASEVMKFCNLFTGMTKDVQLLEEHVLLYETFRTMVAADKKEPSIYGAISGLLYGEDTSYEDEIEQTVLSYLRGSFDQAKQGTQYLRGLFYTARDIVFLKSSFLETLNELFQTLDTEQYFEILPSLRMAFRTFTPFETNMIAERVAKLCNTSKQKVKEKLIIDYHVYSLGNQLDHEIAEIQKRRWAEYGSDGI